MKGRQLSGIITGINSKGVCVLWRPARLIKRHLLTQGSRAYSLNGRPKISLSEVSQVDTHRPSCKIQVSAKYVVPSNPPNSSVPAGVDPLDTLAAMPMQHLIAGDSGDQFTCALTWPAPASTVTRKKKLIA